MWGSKMGLQTNALSKELAGTPNKVALGMEVTNTAAQSAGGVAEGYLLKMPARRLLILCSPVLPWIKFSSGLKQLCRNIW